MVMVVVIIGIMAKVALPKFNINRYRADGAGRLARMLLQEAQRNAITRQSNVIVSFDSGDQPLPRRAGLQQQRHDQHDRPGAVPQHGARARVFAKPSWSGAVGADSTVPAAAHERRGARDDLGPSDRSSSAATDRRARNITLFVTTTRSIPTEYRELVVTASTGRTDLYKFNGIRLDS